MAESLSETAAAAVVTAATGQSDLPNAPSGPAPVSSGVNHIVRPSQLAGSGSSRTGEGASSSAPGIKCSSVPAGTGASTASSSSASAPSGGSGTNNTSAATQQTSVAAATSKGKGAAAPTSSNTLSSSSGDQQQQPGGSSHQHRPSTVRRSSAAVPIQQTTSSPPPYSWVQSHQQQRSSVSVAGSSYPLDEPDQAIEGAGYNWSARNQATWSGPVPLLVRRVSTSGGGSTRYAGSLNRRSGRQHPPASSSLRLVNGGPAANGYPSSEEELTSPARHRRHLHQQQQQHLLGLNGRSDELGYYGGQAGSSGGVSGYTYTSVRTCSDSLVTALEDEASTSSFVPDYLVAGADDMNFINKDNAAGGSAAGSFVAGGGRVHFSNSAAGGDDVSLYGTPKEEAGPGPGPANMGGEPKPSFIRNQLQALFQPTDNKLAMKLFGSKKALMKERIRQKAAGHWIIHPCSNFRFVPVTSII